MSNLTCFGMVAGILSPLVHAAPQNGVITVGAEDSSITTVGNVTTITQGQDLLAIDWDSFDVEEDEIVSFLQSESDIAINRILDESASTIHGSIQADGHVILVNPRGVLFTETATVNVGALTVSGLAIDPSEYSDDEFLNSDFVLESAGVDGQAGFVINRGVINASSAVLVGKYVENSLGDTSLADTTGLIQAELVVLAAGDAAALTFDSDGLIGVEVTSAVAENTLGVESAVLNSGSIESATVLMEANVSSDLFTAAVNNEGSIQARGIDTSDGKIRLFGSGGSVINSGDLEVSLLSDGVIEDVNAQLEVNTTDSFVNTGSIEATNFSFLVGQSGEGSENELGDIEFSGTAVITGGEGEDKYTLSSEAEYISSGAVEHSFSVSKSEDDSATSISFSDIEVVDAGSNSGVTDKLITATQADLTGAEKELVNNGTTFQNLDAVDFSNTTTGIIAGSSSSDTFEIVSSSELIANDITFTDFKSTIDAGVESDASDADILTTATQVNLTGTAKELINTGITFQNMDSVTFTDSITGVIVGSEESDTFTLVSDSEITANEIAFTGFNRAIDANSKGDGSDTDILLGTDGVDEFAITDSGDLEVGGNLVFSNLEIVDAGADSGVIDTLTTATQVDLTGTAKELINTGITFQNLDSVAFSDATTGIIAGSSNSDTFEIVSSSELIANDITFTDFNSTIDAGVESDASDADILATATQVDLTGTAKELINTGITFQNMDSVTFTDSITGVIVGSEESDTFTLVSDSEITANEIAFTGFNRAIDANSKGDGSDTDILLGTDGVDEFAITDSGDLEVGGNLVFSNLEIVDAGADSGVIDTLTTATQVDLTGTAKELINTGITFQNLDSVAFSDATTGIIAGSSNSDTFEVVSSSELIANDITFTDFNSTIDAGVESDASDADILTTATQVDLTGTAKELINTGITFQNMDSVTFTDSTTGVIVGSEESDTFALVSYSEITANEIAFTGFNRTIDANSKGDGSDTDVLLGTDGVDEFAITDSGDLEVGGSLVFSNLEIVDAGADSGVIDTLTTATQVDLTGTAKELINTGITFQNLDSVAFSDATTGIIAGSSNSDTFEIVSSSEITANEISFTGFNSTIDAGIESDASDADTLITASQVDLTGTAKELINTGITFQNMDSVAFSDATTGIIAGSSNSDTFEVVSSSELIANDITFTDFNSTIDAGTESDASDADTLITATQVDLTGTAKELINTGITFQNMDSVTFTDSTTGVIVGSEESDTFALVSDSEITANEIAFTGFNRTIDANSKGDGSDIDVLLGTDGVDEFAITDSGDLEVGGSLVFSNLEIVDAGADSGVIDTLTTATQVDLTGTAKELINTGITFQNMDSVAFSDATTGIIAGSSNSDTFEIVSSSEITANEISFTGFNSTIDAGIESDASDADTLITATQVDLTGTAKELINTGITFQNMDSVAFSDATTGIIAGSSNSDTFEIVSSSEITANEISFTGFNSTIDAGVESDASDADTLITATQVDLTGTAKELINTGITFQNMDSVAFSDATTGTIAGSSNSDTFEIVSSSKITANEISFTGFNSTIDAGIESDVSDADTLITATQVDLTGTAKELINTGITFQNMDSVTFTDSTTGVIVGSEESDTFALVSDSEITANEIAFTGFNRTIDANSKGDGSDTDILLGTDGVDEFAITDSGDLEVGGSLVFSNLEIVDAGADSGVIDTLTTATQVDLTGTAKELINTGITFQNMDSVAFSDATTGIIAGSSNSDTFEIVSSSEITANEISFTGFNSTIDAGVESDASDADTLITATQVDLTGTAKELINTGITFQNMDSVAFSDATTGIIAGSSNSDTFEIVSSSEITANEISFTGFNSTIDAGVESDASDADTLITATQVDLTGTAKELINTGITFQNMDSVAFSDATTGIIAGSSNSDTFEIVSSSEITANEISFTGFNSTIDAGIESDASDADTLITATQVDLTGTAKELINTGITFQNMDSVAFSDATTGIIAGSSNSDTFEIVSSSEITANEISFTGFNSTIDAGVESDASDADTLITATQVDLTGTAKELINTGITFQNMDSVAFSDATTGIIAGSSNSDTFEIVSSSEITANEISFTGFNSTIDAGVESDASDADTLITATQVDLTGTAKELINTGITFQNMDSVAFSDATTGIIAGSSNSDIFEIVSSSEITANEISFTGFNSTIDAGVESDASDADTLITATQVDLTGTAKELINTGITFQNMDSVAFSDATTGIIAGSSNSDTFEIVSSSEITANEISFTGFNSTIDAGVESDASDADTLITATQVDLTGTAKELINTGITFQNMDSVAFSDATTGIIAGSSNSDTFEIVSSSEITANEISFTGFNSTIDAGIESDASDADTLITATQVDLTGTAKELINTGITFQNMDSVAFSDATTGIIAGSSNSDTFEIVSSSEITANEISFTGFNSTIDAGVESNASDADTLITATQVDLTGTAKELINTGITFQNMDSVAFSDATTGTIAGSSNSDTFEIVSSSEITANEISFTGFNSTIDAGIESDASDADTLITATQVDLTGTAKELINTGITFQNMDSVTFTDSTTGVIVGSEESDTFALVSDSEITANEIAFTGFNRTIDANSKGDGSDTDILLGTDGVDEFAITDSGDLEVGGSLVFSNLEIVDAGADSGVIDTLTTATQVDLTGTAKELINTGITFQNMDSVAFSDATTGIIAGSSNSDTFEIVSSSEITANEISFTGFNSTIDAGIESDASDADTLITASQVDLTGTAKELINTGITFQNMDSVTFTDSTTGVIVGSEESDTFALVSDSEITANEIAFTGFNRTIDANSKGDGSDTDILLGTDGVDEFAITDSGDLEVGGSLVFSNLEIVDAGADSGVIDTLTTATQVDLTGTAKELINTGITFQNMDSVAFSDATTGIIAGSSNSDTFEIVSSSEITANEISFTGFNSTIDAGIESDASDADTLITATQVDLTGTAKELINTGITFQNMDSVAFSDATTGIIAGSSNSDTFEIVSSSEITANEISFTGFNSTIDAGVESDASDADTLITATQVDLTGTAKELINTGITFQNMDSVAFSDATTGIIAGSSNSDTFEIVSSSEITANEISFTGFNSTIDAGIESDASDADTLITATQVDLTGTAKELINTGITFQNMDSVAFSDATTGIIAGSSNSDTFEIVSSSEITANEISFTGFNSTIDAGVESDASDADTLITATQVDLTGTAKELINTGITFQNMDSVAFSDATTGIIAGSSNSDTFEIVSSSEITANEISFTGFNSTIDAGIESDASDADTLITATQVDLTGTAKELINTGITFQNMDSVAFSDATTGIIAGSSNSDTFEIVSSSEITANEISFTGFNSTIDAGVESDASDADTLITATQVDLTGTAKELINTGITFQNMDSVAFSDATTGIIAGSSNSDTFEIVSSSEITANEISFTGFNSTIDAGVESDASDADTLITATQVDLTGTAKELINTGITFQNMDSVAFSDATTGIIAGSSNSDIFEIVSSSEITANEISFTGFNSTIDAGVESDASDADTLITATQVDLTGTAKELINTGITFQNMDSVAFSDATTGIIAGSSNSDTFEIVSSSEITANEISFTGFNSTIDAGVESDASDADTLITATQVDLTGTAKELINTGITFQNMDSVAFSDATTGIIAGSSNSDTFEIVSSSEITANEISFTGFNSTIDAGIESDASDADTLITATQVDLTGTAKELINTGITFQNMDSVAFTDSTTGVIVGSEESDTFALMSDSEITANEIAFTGFNRTIDANSKGDGSDTDILLGTDGVDEFVLTDSGDLEVGGSLVFSNLETVDALGGADTLEVDEAYIDDGEINGILFLNLSDIAASYLSIGADQSGDFHVLGSGHIASDTDGDLSNGYEYNFTSVENVITNGFANSVTGYTGEDWIVTAENAATNYEINFEGVTLLIADDAGVIGLDGYGWALASSDNQVVHAGITIADAGTVSGGNGALSSIYDDHYIFNDDADEVTVDSMVFADLSSIAASGSADSVSGGANYGWSLTATDNQVVHNGVTITGAEALSGGDGSLSSSETDSYSFNDDADEVTVDSMVFADLSSIAASGSADSVSGGANYGWSLTATDNQVVHNGVTITGAEALSGGDGSLSSSETDSYSFNDDADEVTVDSMVFADLSSIAASGSADSVSGGANYGWSLTATDNQVVHNGVTITGAEALSGGDGSLSSSETDSYSFNDDADEVTVDSMVFADLSSIAASGSADSVSGGANYGWSLTATDNQVVHNGVTITGAEALSGGDGSLSSSETDSYSFNDDADEVTVDSMVFADLSSIAASGSADSVSGGANYGWSLTATDNQVVHNGVTITGAEALSGGDGSLSSSETDSYSFNDDADEVTVDSMVFAGLSSIAASGSADSVSGGANYGWSLTATDNQVVHNGVTITGAEALSGGDGSLSSSETDSYSFNDDADEVTVDSMVFADLSSIAASGSADSVSGGANYGWSLTATDNQVVHNGVTITGAEALSGGDGSLSSSETDSYSFNDDADEVTVDSMVFADLSSIAASGSADSVSGGANYGWSLTATDNQVVHNGVTITGAEALSGGDGSLSSSETDSYSFNDDADEVTVDSMVFADLSSIAASGSADSVSGGANYGWSLTATDNQVVHNGVTITGAEALSGGDGSLSSSETDSYSFNDDADEVTVDSMVFAGLSSIAASGSADSVSGGANYGWSLTATDNQVVHNGVTITGAEALSGGDGSLSSSETDSYSFNDDADEVTVDSMVFAGLSSIAASGSADSVSGGANYGWSLTATDNQVVHNGVTITGAEALSGGDGSLSSSETDSYSFNDDADEVTVDSMVFADLSSIAASGSADSVSGGANYGWSLTATDNQVVHNGVTITGAEALSGGDGSLSSSETDSYSFNDDADEVTVDSMVFADLSSIAASGSADSVSGGANYGWSLTATDNQVVHNGVTITGAEALSGGDGSLSSSETDSYSFNDDADEVTVDSMVFADLSSIAASGSADSVSGGANYGWSLTATDNQVVHNGVTITGAEALSGGDGSLSSSETDSYSFNDDADEVTVDSMVFAGLSSIAASGSADSVSGGANYGWSLTATDNQVVHNGVTITGAEALSGGDGSLSSSETDSYSFNDDADEVTVDSMVFADLSSIAASGSADSVSGGANYGWSLTATDNQVVHNGVTITGAEALSGGDGSLSSSETDSYSFNDDADEVTVDSMVFADLSSIAASGSADSVSGGANYGWSLTATDNQVVHNGVTITGAEALSGGDGSLSSSETDSYSFNDDADEVTVDSMVFAGLSSIAASGSADSVSGGANYGWSLTATDNQVVHNGVTITGAEALSGGDGSLSSSETDSYSFNDDADEVTVDSMVFADLSSIAASGSADSVSGGANYGWSLTATDNQVVHNGVTITGAEALSGGDGSLSSSETDSYSFNDDADEVTVDSMVFADLSSIAASGSADSVSGGANYGWSLTATDNQVVHNGVTITGAEALSGGDGSLSSSETDSYSFNDDADEVTVDSMVFADLSSIAASGSADSVSGGANYGWSLTATDNQVVHNGVTITGAEALSGGDGSLSSSETDSYSFNDDADEVTVDSMVFAGLSSIAASGSADSVSGGANYGWSLTATDNQVVHNGVTITGAEALSGGDGSLSSSETDSYSFNDDADEVTVDSMVFADLSSIAASGSADSVSGGANYGWSLTATDNQVVHNGVTITGAEALSGGDGSLSSSETDSYSFNDDADEVTVDSMVFADLSSIAASGSADSVSGGANYGWSLTATDNQVVHNGVTITGAEALSGGDGSLSSSETDSYSFNDDADEVTVDSMVFADLSSIAASGSADSVSGGANYGWSLTATDNQVVHNGVTITGAEALSGGDGSLSSSETDSYSFNDDADEVTVDSMVFADLSSIAASGSADSVSGGANYGWSLTATDNQVVHNGVTITGAEALSGGDGSLSSSETDSYSFNDDADEVTVDSMVFAGLSSIAASGSADSVSGGANYGWSLTATDNQVVHNGVTITGAEALSGGDGSLSSSETDSYSFNDDADEVTVDSMVFADLSSIAASGSADSVSGGANYGWSLTATDNQVVHNGVTITGAEALSGGDGSLSSSETDSYSFNDDADEVTVDSMVFADLSSIAASGSADSVSGGANYGWSLTATDNQVVHNGVTITGAEALSGGDGSLSSSETDSYSFNDDADEVTVDSMVFADLSSIAASGSADSVSGGANYGWSLTATDNQVVHNGVTITGAEALSGGDGSLSSSETDSYSFNDDADEVTVDSMVFADLSSIAASGSADSVSGGANYGWSLTATDNQVVHNGVTITGAEALSGGDGSLSSSETDSYSFNDDADEVTVDSMVFADLSSIAASGSADSVSGGANYGWSLTATDNQVVHNGVTITGAEALSGGDGSLSSSETDSYSFNDDADEVTVDSMVFADLSSIAASGSADSVSGGANYGWSLTATDNQVVHNGVTITGAEALSGGDGSLSSSETDSYSFNDDADEVTVDSMVFADLSSIAASGSADSVSGGANYGWSLTATDNQVVHNGVTITGAEALSGGDGSLSSSETDSYSFNDDADEVTVDSMVFAGLSSIAASGSADSVSGGANYGWSLTATDNQVVHNGVTITGAEALSGGDGSLSSSETDSYSFNDDADEVTVDSMVFADLSSIAASGSADSVSGGANYGWSLTATDNQVVHNGVTITGAEALSGGDGSLSSSETDSYSFNDDADEVTVDSMVFADLSSIAASGSADSVSGGANYGWSLTATDNQVVHNGVTITGAEALSGGDGSLSSSETDSYSFNDDADEVTVDSMVFADLSSIAASGSADSVSGGANYGWSLTATDNQVVHNGVTITGAEALSGGDGSLSSSNSDDFTISSEGGAALVTVDNMEFSALFSIAASGTSDSIIGTESISSESWTLGQNQGDIAITGIDFSGIEMVDADNAIVDAATYDQSDVFELSKLGQELKVRGITFSSVSQVAAGTSVGDQISSDATSWQLSGVNGEVTVNDVEFSGIDAVATNNAQLLGTGADDTFELTDNGLESAGISFTGINLVTSYDGADKLIGTSGNDQFTLSSEGDISVAGINFTGLEILDAGTGDDTVIADGATWTSSVNDNSLVSGGAVATVNSISVEFDNLELVEGAGVYVGQDVASEYVFSSLDTMTVGGVTFAGLESLSAGSAEDSLYGANVDANWDITASQNSVSTSEKSLSFSGIEFIYAGTGVDIFNLSGGQLNGIDSGEGDDAVTLSGTTIDSISLGDGDDYLQVDTAGDRAVALSGGSGNDSFQYNMSDDVWQIFSTGNSVGNYDFSEFELLDNTASNLSLETDLSFDFVDGGDYSGPFNSDGAGLSFHSSGIRLGYDGTGDISVVSSSSGTIGGVLKANRAELTVAGDVDIESDVGVLGIATSGPDVDITVLAQEDLVIDEIDAGRGNVQLASLGFGALTAETYGDTHITAANVTLGTDTELWSVIGSELIPLRMDATQNVEIVSISYYEPEFISQVPSFTSKGDELQSIAGAQAAQGLRSAVQNSVEDFTQLDPAIFSAVNPYTSGVDAVNSPEMRLKSGELQPAAAAVEGVPEANSDFDAVLDEGASDSTADQSDHIGLSGNAGM
ncbi:beta strand repeat-containing protein [Microbulbifer sp. ANSA005]|uniref:beta strand repeat-containing protein n=1 Tax=Microbulbifer sp. ANSA005 TaxID=3243362 RepID=UPI00404276BB